MPRKLNNYFKHGSFWKTEEGHFVRSAIAMSVTTRKMAEGSNKGMCHVAGRRWDKGGRTAGGGETMGVEIEVG